MNWSLLAILVLLTVAAMAQVDKDAASETKAINLEGNNKPDEAEAADPNANPDKQSITMELHSGGRINTPEQWKRIVEKDKARAQWIAGRINQAPVLDIDEQQQPKEPTKNSEEQQETKPKDE